MSDFVSPEIGRVFRGRQEGRALDRARLAEATNTETTRFVDTHRASARAFEQARRTLRAGVPMDWMIKWAGPFPLFVESAQGTVVRDVDGNEYVDFCLGDTGAMAGHAPNAVTARLAQQLAHGLTTMLPTADAAVAGELLAERFGLPLWEFATTATDANRAVVRHARRLTGRTKICVFNWCYHGMLDETLVRAASDGSVASRVDGAGIDVRATTKVVEFNDLDGLERALRPGDVACVLTEPALTNVGIVLPEPGFHDALRELTSSHGSLLILDETHTICAGPSGYVGLHNLEPDFLTIGKAIGGGVPAGAWGISAGVAERVLGDPELRHALVEGIGVGGTLAGNVLSARAISITLANLLTAEDFDHTSRLAHQWSEGVRRHISDLGLPWHVTQLGARAEYHFCSSRPRNGSDLAAVGDEHVERFIRLYLTNRGILTTPFHNMALMAPTTTPGDVARHEEVLGEALHLLAG